MILSIPQRKNNNNKQAWKKIPGFVVIYRYKSQKLTLIFIKFHVLYFIFYVKCYILSLASFPAPVPLYLLFVWLKA